MVIETRNILLIGRTGGGKSTLGNVLVNKNDNFDEVFEESAGGASKTRGVEESAFELDVSKDGSEKIRYRVIDTIGLGDTKLTPQGVLTRLAEIADRVKSEGLNQILFVNKGRFTKEEVEAYDLLSSIIFDEKVIDFTTVVRVAFPSFENKEKCADDRASLKMENADLAHILDSVNIIYVDNPPLEGRSKIIELAKETREESRKRLLTYLGTCQNIYYPANLAEFKKRIDDYQTKSEQLEKELAEKEQAVREQEEKLQNDVRATQTKQQIDLELSRRKFEQKLKNATSGYEWKLKYTQEQLENKYQEQLKNSQQRYEREQAEAEERRKSEVNRIESEFKNRKVRVGEAVCSRGHSNVEAYNKHGNHPNPDDFDDTISYVYCSSCGKNDYNCEVRNAKTYNFEEWCRMRNQSYARELEQMNRQIQEQQRRKQETLDRIEKERKDRDILFEKELEREKQLQEQVSEKERKIQEEWLNSSNSSSESKIASSSREKINRLNRELVEKKRELDEHRRQSQMRKNTFQRQMDAYVEQLIK